MPRTTPKEVIYKVEEVKQVMHENIEQATKNCIKLESIELKAEDLMKDAAVFRTNAKNLKNKLWWKQMKMWFIISGIVLVVIGILVAVIYTQISSQKSS